MSGWRHFIGFGSLGTGIWVGGMECTAGRAQFGVTLMCAGFVLMLTVLPGNRPPAPPVVAAIPCSHRSAIPVESVTGEVIAKLCPDCDEQLDAGFTSPRPGVIADPAVCWTCPDCGAPSASRDALVSHWKGSMECRERVEWRQKRPSSNWDQWCTCGQRFSQSVARNKRAMAAHRASGECPHATIRSVR